MPLFSGKRRVTVRECLVQILADEFPLSINELKSRIRSRYSTSVTYQAVHKEVNCLIEQGVLQREDDTFLLNMGWVMQNMDFFKRAESNVQNRSVIRYVSFDLNETLCPSKFDSLVWDEEIPRLYAKRWRVDIRTAKRDVYAEYYKSLYVEKIQNWMELAYWFNRLGLTDWKSLLSGVSKHAQLYDDVAEMLALLSRRYRLVVFARGDARLMELKLEATGMRKYFTHILSTSTTLKMQNKDKVAYEALLARLHIKPEQIMHVGNDLGMDYDAPTSVGIRSFLLDRSGTAEGPHIIHSLKELQHHL